MKLTIEDGRDSFYTFDTNRILLLTATDEEQINQVEFSTEENGEAVSWTSDVLTGEDGIKYVQVPNEFLNGNYSRLVCYYVALDSKGEFTRQKEVFRIRSRQEPQDYYLTYSERVTFASIKALTEQYKVNASNSADLARRYAEESEDVNVETGTYSSKHWSAKSEKKFQEIKDYVGSTSDPKSALGSIESARTSAVSDVNKQKTDSIEAVGTYTSNTAIPSVSQYVESTAKPALKTYGEQQVNSYVNGTSKPELDRYVNNEKKQVLDNYTSEKKSELDNYTENDKKQVLDSYTDNEKKTELNTHVEGLKGQLDSHTVAKTGELNEYTTGLKSELDGYTTAKEQDISEFTEQKKTEVQGVYQTDLNELKGDLDTERNARIEADTEHSTRLQKVEVASSVNRYEIENLKAKAEGQIYREEIINGEAYTLDVPSSVSPYAELQKIGGKSVVWNQLIDYSKMVEQTYKGITFKKGNDGYLYANGTASGSAYTKINSFSVKAGDKFYIKVNPSIISNDFIVQINDGSEQNYFENKPSIYTAINNIFNVFFMVKSNITVDNVSIRPIIINLTQMFGAGNEPTLEECQKIFSAEYYPFDAGTIKSFPVQRMKSFKADGTELGSIDVSSFTTDLKSALNAHDEWSNGKVTKRIGVVDLGTLGWNYVERMFANLPGCKISGYNIPNIICKLYTTTKYSNVFNKTSDKIISIHDNNQQVNIYDSEYTDATTFKQAMSGVILYYELAKPIEEEIAEIDNYLEVEGGGRLTFESDATISMPVPSTTRFVVDLTSTTEETT